MPWPSLRNMTDLELRAIYEYLSAPGKVGVKRVGRMGGAEAHRELSEAEEAESLVDGPGAAC